MNGRPQHSWGGTITVNPLRSRIVDRVAPEVGLEAVHRAAVEVDDRSRRVDHRGERGRPAPPAPPRREGPPRERRAAARAGGCRAPSLPSIGPCRFLRPMLASGASGTPKRASRSVSLMSRLREARARARRRSSARARLFVSAMSTPCGQARVQMPQPEQRSTVRSGEASCDRWTAEALRLRADVLRPREGIGHAGDRADRGADVALHAGVGRVRRELARRRVVDRIMPPPPAGEARERAARWALASATPSPQRWSR